VDVYGLLTSYIRNDGWAYSINVATSGDSPDAAQTRMGKDTGVSTLYSGAFKSFAHL
jgi:hypothetical protein